MKAKSHVLFALFGLFSLMINAQKLEGKWQTIDDETGEAKSIIEIYKKNNAFYGKVVQLLQKEDQNRTCIHCTGNKKDKPIVGLEILEGLSKSGNAFSGGKILDPKNGKTYKCNIEFVNNNEIKVRGYIGISLIGRSQTWKRAS